MVLHLLHPAVRRAGRDPYRARERARRGDQRHRQRRGDHAGLPQARNPKATLTVVVGRRRHPQGRGAASHRRAAEGEDILPRTGDVRGAREGPVADARNEEEEEEERGSSECRRGCDGQDEAASQRPVLVGDPIREGVDAEGEAATESGSVAATSGEHLRGFQ